MSRQKLTVTQEGNQLFTGLAHWIKGGVFFWLGVVTLGRWAGCFGELGWVSLPILRAWECTFD